jgi:TetR/AcrR family transcriptional regulator, transcriptional repressor for nem operon
VPAQSDSNAEIKARMIRAAAELFHEEGVRVATPEDVVRASGGTLTQFYHIFRNKEGLIHEVIRAEFEAVKSGATPLVCDFVSWANLENWFLTHLELQRKFDMTRTCLFGKVGIEVAERDGPIREEISAIFEFMKSRIVEFLKKEKAAGRLAMDANESSLADFCIATVHGAMLLGKVKKDSRPVEAAVREAIAHLRTYVVARS